MTSRKEFSDEIRSVSEYTIGLRRELHENPELSGQESETSARIARELELLGIPYVVDEKRNVIGKLVCSPEGKRLAIRGDFDALPVTEETGVPYASKVPGVMHACGHDAHAAGLLGAAKVLVQKKDQLRGTIYFCFQMGEETCDGAPQIVDYLEREGGVDMVVSAHLMPGFPPFNFVCCEGPMMAGALMWSIKVYGKGGHGSTPWMAVDTLKPAAEILLRITALPCNRFTPFDEFVVSPCMLQGGVADNVVPDETEIRGTLRFYKSEHATEIPALMGQIARDIAASYGATAEITTGAVSMPVVNDPEAVRFARSVSEELGIPMFSMGKTTGSDNFGDFLQKFKGFYFYSGITKPGDPLVINHHSTFNIDEDAMLCDTEFFVAFAKKYLV